MIITGITKLQFTDAVDKAGVAYGDNLRPEFGTEHSKTRFNARVLPRATGSRLGLKAPELAPGQRRSASYGEKRINAVCWHAYRDVLIEVFNINPDARVYTSMARYRGKDSFYELFPQTARVNMGSAMYPVTMPECCDC